VGDEEGLVGLLLGALPEQVPAGRQLGDVLLADQQHAETSLAGCAASSRRGRLAAVEDVVEFLRDHEPFGELDERALARLAARVEVESFAPGEMIFRQGDAGMRHVGVVRRGSVELVDGGRVLDLLGEGEWFGHPAMLSGLPTGAVARAAEDTVVYRLAAEDVVPQAHAPPPIDLPARALLREELVSCAPDTPIREAARRMADARASCAVIRLPSGQLGILTDRDLRVRVVAGGMALDGPVSGAMSAPAVTVDANDLGSELMLAMVDEGVRHLPVVGERGELVGVVTDVDLLAAEARAPLLVRRAIDEARDVGELRRAAAQLRPSVVALHDARVGATRIGAMLSTLVDALVRRLVELRTPAESLPPFSWLSLGSYGRREPVPSSDIDSALAWEGDAPPRLAALAEAVAADLDRCGLAADPHAANATNPLFARSAGEWRATIVEWLEHPGEAEVLIAVSLLVDGRVVASRGEAPQVLEVLAESRHHPSLMRLLQRLAVTYRPPTGFLRDIVVEHDGEHRGHFNIKRGGLLPIVDIARYAGMAAGATSTSTPDRLRAAAAAGVLKPDEAVSLREAFDLFAELRLEHQVEQLRAAEAPDDFVDPKRLNTLARRYVREAFRVVAATQRALTNDLVYR
jgi:CBS domain-containing protein